MGNINSDEVQDNLKNIILKAALVGGILGAAAAIAFPYFVTVVLQTSDPVFAAFSGAVIGIIAGILPKKSYRHEAAENTSLKEEADSGEAKLQLRREMLRILRKRVQTGEVKIHKEVYKKEKSFKVPVTYEDIVIEKNNLEKGAGTETIRIPISEEQISIIKRPVKLQKVSVYRRKINDTEHIDKTLKREKAYVKITGEANINGKNYKKHED